MTTPGVAAAIDWRTAILKPGEGQAGPVAALAAALFAALPELAEGDFPTAAALADNCSGGCRGCPAGRGCARAHRRGRTTRAPRRAPLRPALLLLVDQLDELFAGPMGKKLPREPSPRPSPDSSRTAASGASPRCAPSKLMRPPEPVLKEAGASPRSGSARPRPNWRRLSARRRRPPASRPTHKR